MTNTNVINPKVLSAEAYEQLTELIANAFMNPQDLEMHLKFKLNIDLYKDITDKNTTFKVQVFSLLKEAECHGLTTDLLRSIISERRRRQDLYEAVARYWPQALEETVSEESQVRTLVAGVKAIRSHLVSPHLLKKLDELMRKVDILFNYKTLHDCLHTIQLRQYPTMIERVKSFCTDPLASAELDAQNGELADTCKDARSAVELLPDTAAIRAQELQWLETLESAHNELSKAIDNYDIHGAVHAVRLVRRVIRQEPFRINALLTITAEQLSLEELRQPIEEAIGYSADESSILTLQNAITSLQHIQRQLKGRVAEHKLWQEIENDFWEAENCIEQKTPESIEEFRSLWSDAKSRIELLTRAEPETDWAKAIGKLIILIDENIIANIELSIINFKCFRKAALDHFYRVDKTLKAQCAEIINIREPLRSLLDEA